MHFEITDTTLYIGGKEIATISAEDLQQIIPRIRLMFRDGFPRWCKKTESGSTEYDALTGMEIALMFIAIAGGVAANIVFLTITYITPEERWWMYHRLSGYDGGRKAIALILGSIRQ